MSPNLRRLEEKKHDCVKGNQKSKKQTETEKQIKGLGCFWPQGWVPANLANVV